MSLPFKFSARDIISQGKTSEENVEEIKKWLLESNLKYVPKEVQDEMLVLFLLSCNNDKDLAKKTIESHYRIKKEAPHIFNQRQMHRQDVRKAFRTIKMIRLPGRTEGNNAVIYFRLRDTNYRNMDVIPIMKASFMLLDLEEASHPPDGIIYITDMTGFGLMHLSRIRLDPLRKYFAYLGEGMPIKFVAMHFLNANYALDRLLSIIRVFLMPDLMRKLHMHRRDFPHEELFKIVSKKYLPKELGGDLGEEDELCETTINLLKERQHFWDVEEEIRQNC